MNVIEMHATWLTINSIIGCTNGCKYCFLQNEGNNIKKPKIIKNEKASVKELINSKYYTKNIPICLLPNTDAFLNQTNIEYLKNLLLELKKNKINNILTIVTKCYIPTEFIEFLKENNFTKQLVIYLSFSGLSKNFEPNVNHDKIKENFINLSQNNIKIIHYFRPLTPYNGTEEKINEILTFVNKYTKVSVITGLKVKPNYYELIDFWPELKKCKKDVLASEGVWPKEGFNYIYKRLKIKHYLFQTNFCALRFTLNQPCPSYYNSYECENYNICPYKQRKLCQKNSGIIDINEIKYELRKINKYTERIKVIKQENGIMIENANLSVGDVSYLTEVLNIKIFVENKNEDDAYFNSSLVGAKPLIIGGESNE